MMLQELNRVHLAAHDRRFKRRHDVLGGTHEAATHARGCADVRACAKLPKDLEVVARGGGFGQREVRRRHQRAVRQQARDEQERAQRHLRGDEHSLNTEAATHASAGCLELGGDVAARRLTERREPGDEASDTGGDDRRRQGASIDEPLRWREIG